MISPIDVAADFSPPLLTAAPRTRSTQGLRSVWLVIPAYNEAKVISDTLRSVRAVFINIVVVDDCSADATGQLSLQAGAHVCRHPINLGQGAALQTGIDYALAQGAEMIVTFDADGQHQPADAREMVETLDRLGCDVVLASRVRGLAEGISGTRQTLLKLATWYTRLTTGLAITDTHNGLRAFTRSAAQALRIRQNRMAHASEILETIGRLKLHYVEIPCTITYTEYSRAKGQRLSGAFAILADLYLRRLYK
jgi:polyprenyl-phospho-N-acetylgalactosaminyl synthase